MTPTIIGEIPATPTDGETAEVVQSGVVDMRPSPSAPGSAAAQAPNVPVLLKNVAVESFERTPTTIAPLDAVLGGGLVAGSVLLLVGEAGTGKSSLVKQAMAGLGERVLLATGEETVAQVADRARRIGVTDAKIYVVAETDLAEVLQQARSARAAVIVIDSIQTLQCQDIPSMAGSITQIKECTARLVKFAKATDVAVWMIGHVTSDGSIAGPTFLKHMVDVVLEMENGRGSERRLRCLNKNRFGRTTVVGRFEQTDNGLVPVDHYDLSEGPDPGEDPADADADLT